jgi:hypothetical protein
MVAQPQANNVISQVTPTDKLFHGYRAHISDQCWELIQIMEESSYYRLVTLFWPHCRHTEIKVYTMKALRVRGLVAPGTNWINVWVGPEIGLDDLEGRKYPDHTRTRIRSPRSSSPYPTDYTNALSGSLAGLIVTGVTLSANLIWGPEPHWCNTCCAQYCFLHWGGLIQSAHSNVVSLTF